MAESLLIIPVILVLFLLYVYRNTRGEENFRKSVDSQRDDRIKSERSTGKKTKQKVRLFRLAVSRVYRVLFSTRQLFPN